MKRGALFLISAVILLCLSGAAEAQSRIVVLDFSGPRAANIRNQAVRGLSDHDEVELIPSAQAGSPENAADFASVASDLGLRAFIGGRVTRRGRRFTVTIVARDSTGAEIHREEYRGRNANGLGRNVQNNVWDDFSEAILNAPEPVAGPSGDEGSGDEGGGDSAGPSPTGPVVVLPFDGPGAGRARSRVVSALEDAGVEIVPKEEAEGRGDLDEAGGRRAVARHLGVAALIGGEVEREGRSYTATVVVYDGRDGEEIDSAEFEGRTANALLSAIESSLWDEIRGFVAEGAVPEAGDDDDDDDGGDGWSGPDGPLPSPLTLIAEFAGFGREYSYTDDLFGALRAYSLGFAPMVGAKLYYFPAAHFTNSFAANIGLDARIETAFGVKSQDSAGQEFPTSMWGFGLHGRVRIPIADHHLSAIVGYGMQSFRIEAISPTIPAPDVPDVDYGFLRIGAELRLLFGAFVTELKFSMLPLLGSGQLGSDEWFPRTTGGGMEAGLVLGVLITDWFELRAGFEYRRFWFSMNPEPGDTYVAGGALDHYFIGNIGLGLHWPGSD